MTRINALALFVVIVACAACGAPAAMAETSEFTNVGSQLKETGGKTVFTAAGPPVTCTGSKGSGGVASSTQLKLEVLYEGCTLSVGKESFKGKVTTCHLGYEVEDAVKVESGCVVNVSECSLTPSNKQLKTVLYNSVEDKEGKVVEREMKIYMELRHVVYKVTGSSCVLLGIKGSEEGTIIDPAEMQVVGARANPLRQIRVAGATLIEPFELELSNTSNQVFSLPGSGGKTITCTSMVWKGTATNEDQNLRFLDLLPPTCKSNIYLNGGNEVAATITWESCELGIFVANRPLQLIQPAITGQQALNEGCEFKAEVTGTATCVITFQTETAMWGNAGLVNEGTTPDAVSVRFPNPGNQTAIPYSANANCPGVATANSPSAIFSGTSKLRAWFLGGQKAVKVV